MFSLRLPVAIMALLAISSTFAQDCGSCYDNCLCSTCAETVQCQVCGNQGGSPYICDAYNSTFDTYKPKATVDNYNRASYTGFTVAQRNTANPIVPASKKNYLRSTSGTGLFNFTWEAVGPYSNQGSLYSFDFACADPCTETTSDRAVPCTLTITAGCAEVFAYTDPVAFYFNESYSYVPDGSRYAAMDSVMFTGVGNYGTANATFDGGFCYNYTFEATQADGKPAFLYLDNMVYNTWSY